MKAGDDAEELLKDFAFRADRETDGARWSYCRDLGTTRLIVIDSRAGRVLEEGRRSMLDEDEWDWVDEHATGGFDHLLIGTSLPWLLGPRDALRRGVERGGGGRRLGPPPLRGSPRRCARPSTWSTGRRSRTRSRA